MVELYDKKISIDSIFRSIPTSVTAHMYRVGLLTGILASKVSRPELNFPDGCEEDVSIYGKAAFYHDIGKAFVPLNLLMKSTKFTKSDMASMEKHTLCAQVLFNDIDRGKIIGMPPDLVRPARDASVYHHEWWDGQGYPYGIRGKEIPLIARLTSVCDAYDAMTSNRCYKRACAHNDACRELETCSGTQFDPVLVRLFLDNDKEISEIISSSR